MILFFTIFFMVYSPPSSDSATSVGLSIRLSVRQAMCWCLDMSVLMHMSDPLKISPLTSFSRQRYVCENVGCTPLAMFRMNNAGLGNRAPRPGRLRTEVCSLCDGLLNEFHVAFSCPGMDFFRHYHTDIAFFIAMCKTKGIFPVVAFRLYLRGLDWNLCAVSTPAFIKRGRTLQLLTTDEWLRLSQ